VFFIIVTPIFACAVLFILFFLGVYFYNLSRKIRCPMKIGQRWILKSDFPKYNNKSPWREPIIDKDPCVHVILGYEKGWVKSKNDGMPDSFGFSYYKENSFRDIFKLY
jgi:hypothetical protein